MIARAHFAGTDQHGFDLCTKLKRLTSRTVVHTRSPPKPNREKPLPLMVERLRIEDLIVVRPHRFVDERGHFVETYAKRDFSAAGIGYEFVQDNEALSRERGTLRGLHFQLAPAPQAKLIRVIAGSIFDVAVDLRDGSSTYGQWCGTLLSAQEGHQLLVPVGFAHAYCTLEPDTLVAYKVDSFYNKSAESGLRWDDPDIGIDWPIAPMEIKVSEKDANLPWLRDAATPFRF